MEVFRRQLSSYPDSSLRRIYEYYKDDLVYILENMDTGALLRELKSRNVLNTDKYRTIKEGSGVVCFSHTLLQDIQDQGRGAVLGLWECLYALKKDHPHPNLLAVLDEIRQRGEGLVDQILMDEFGHSLTPELKDIQEKHKQHLMEKTETLVEHRPPGSTLEPQIFPINEQYVNLMVVSTEKIRQHPQNELILTGVKHEEILKETQTGLEQISPNKLFRWNQQSQCVPHAVMVSGVPGIGKTTMMQKFVYDWVTGKHYQRFAFVFSFRFRDLNRLGEVSLEEMILHQYPYLKSQIGDILQDPERLLFIFDGLDESIHQMDFKSSRLFANKTISGEIVVSLVRQSLHKGCSVLITSRPTRLASVDTGVFQRIAEIMGFLHGDRLTFFNNFFGNEELSEKAFHYVQENDTLYTFCYIPSYCWIICTVLSMCFRAQPTITDQLMTSLPKTVTQLFVTFVSNILANHCQNKDGDPTVRELLTSIGWMAEHGVMSHMIVFVDRHLESFRVRNDDHLFSCFMMESGRPPDMDYTFLHLTLQEFFAALVHFIAYNPDRLQKTLDEEESHKDGRAEILLRFLCGLSDSSTRSMLKSHVGELSSQAAKHVITWIQKKIAGKVLYKSQAVNRELLNVFYYLHESRNKALVSQCIGSNKVDFFSIPLSPLDCSVLSFILQSLKETQDVNLGSCNIQDEGLKKFIPALHNMKSLRLSSNHLTDSSCTHLASVITNNQTLRTLDLSGNNLEGPPFRDLMEALTKTQIEELQLMYNHLTDSSCPHLASVIRNNRTLRTLNLSQNNLEGPHFRDLMEALTTSRIEKLQLSSNHLKDSSCPHLASVIRNNQTLRRLNLSGNNLEGPHFRVLMEALTTSRIEELELYDTHLTDISCPHLASGIRNNQTLRTLILSGNNLEGPHFRDLMEALTTSRIEELLLCSNYLKDSSCPHLTFGIRNNHTLRKLNLSENHLEGPHFRDLMEALTTSQIEELQLVKNHLTDSSCPHLASGIRNNQTLKRLNLNENNLEGPHFRDLMEALTTSRVEGLQIGGNNLSEEAKRELEKLGKLRLGLEIYS
ncbi:NACHT, LRR and PYD domains-containing protein 12-like isoform X2 [Lithobates pipiens]